MQDLPWVLPPEAPVGFTGLEMSFYAPVKNSRTEAAKKAKAGGASGGAAEGEHAVYAFNASILRLAGCELPPPSSVTAGGVVGVVDGPRVVLGAAFRPTVGAATARLVGGKAIKITARSALRIDGDVTIESLDLDGALSLTAEPGAKLTVRGLSVRNAGGARRELTAAELADGGGADEVSALRGYVYEVSEAAEVVAARGEQVVGGGELVAADLGGDLVCRLTTKPSRACCDVA